MSLKRKNFKTALFTIAIGFLMSMNVANAQVAYGMINNVDLVKPDNMAWKEDVSFTEDVLMTKPVKPEVLEVDNAEKPLDEHPEGDIESNAKVEIVPTINETPEKAERIAQMNDSKNLEELVSKVKWQFDSYQIAEGARQDSDTLNLDKTDYDSVIQENKWNFEFKGLEDYLN